jgi:two-component system response regulator
MTPLKRILLVEDSPRDAELIRDALGGHQLANEVVHVRDGADALDYLYRRGQFADRSDPQPALILPDAEVIRHRVEEGGVSCHWSTAKTVFKPH